MNISSTRNALRNTTTISKRTSTRAVTNRPLDQPQIQEPDTFVRSSLGKLPKPARNAVFGLASIAPPMIGGILAGHSGLAVGTAVSLGFNASFFPDGQRAIKVTVSEAILGEFMAFNGGLGFTPLGFLGASVCGVLGVCMALPLD